MECRKGTAGSPALTLCSRLLIAEAPASCDRVYRHSDRGRRLVSGANKFAIFSVFMCTRLHRSHLVTRSDQA